MSKKRALAIAIGVAVIALAWIGALSNDLGSAETVTTATLASRPTPVARAAQPAAATLEAASRRQRTQPEASSAATLATSSSGSLASYTSEAGGSSSDSGQASGGAYEVASGSDNRVIALGDD